MTDDVPGQGLGAAFIAVLVALLSAALIIGMPPERTTPGWGPIFMGLFLIVLGMMFLASYFFAWKSFFLRWLLRFSMGLPGLSDARMAFFFCAVCAISGVVAIAGGLGLPLL